MCTPEDQELFNRDSKKGHKFREQYMKKFQIKVRERGREIVLMCCTYNRVYVKYTT